MQTRHNYHEIILSAVVLDSMANPEGNNNSKRRLRAVNDEPVEAAPDPERERIELSGRAGADPTFRTTPNGTLVGRFPLAVHETENTTTWHQIVAFNARAESLKGVVSRGAAVDIVGYLHRREVPAAEGTSRTVTEIYAASVTATPPKGERSR